MAWIIIIGVAAWLLLAWGEGYDPLEGVVNMSNDLVQKLAQAIAKAEGFFSPGSLPNRTNNPGDLKLGDKGLGTVAGKTVFASPEEGFQALERQINLILTGRSDYYSPDMTIREIAQVYTGGDNADAWANIVAGQLGVSPDTPLSEIS
jgi:hypothetical protein